MVKNTKQHGTVEFKDSVNILAELLDAAPGAITVHDLSGRFLYTNQKNLDLHGYEMDEFMNLNLHDVDVPESEALINERIEKIRKNGEATFTVHHFRKDGSIIPLEIFTKITKWGDQPVLLSIATDISERFENEKAVRESEEKYRNLVNEMQSGLALHEIILDENGIPVDYRFLDVNPAFERLTGLKKENILGRTVLEVLPQTEKFWIERYGQVALTGESVEFEDYAAALDRYYSVVAYRPKENQFAVIVQDITEKRRAEEKLKDNLALLRIAGEVTKLGGWNVNLEENRSYWSDVVAKIHEMPAGYAPMLEDGINFYAPEWRDKITKVFTDCATKGISYNEKMEIITATGKRVWIKTIGEAVRNEKGEIYKVHGGFQDITEEVEAENELKKSRKFLADIIENSGNLIFVKDLEGKYELVNSKWEEVTGLSREKTIGKTDIELFEGEIGKQFYNNDQEIIRSGKIREIEEILQNDSSVRYFNSIKFLIKDENGMILGICGMAAEITQRKEAEQQLRESEERFMKLSSFTFEGIIIHDKGIAIDMNQSAVEMLGYERDEITGMNLFKIIHPDFHETVKENIAKQFATPYRIVVIRKNGSLFDAEIEAKDISYNGENFRVACIRDITERKKTEKILKENEEKFRSLFENHSAVKLTIDPETGSILDANRSAEKFYGWNKDELRTKTVFDLNTLPKDELLKLIDCVVKEEKSHFEFNHMKADGSIVDVEVFSSRIVAGDEVFLHSIVHDITDKKIAEKKLRESEEKFRKIFKNIQLGIAEISHDFIIENSN
jgi:PAS domain S-box-containing protein